MTKSVHYDHMVFTKFTKKENRVEKGLVLCYHFESVILHKICKIQKKEYNEQYTLPVWSDGYKMLPDRDGFRRGNGEAMPK